MRLVDGPFYWAVVGAGIAGSGFLLLPRDRRWLLSIAVSLVLATGAVAVIHWLLVNVLTVFPEDLPSDVLAWSAVAFAALVLFLFRLAGSSWRGRSAAGFSFLSVLLLSALQINGYFGLNHTAADLFGHNVGRIPALEDGFKRGISGAIPVSATDGGVVRRASIPGIESGFEGQDAFIYLPPAYLGTERSQLPVLVLFAGQPGRPADWLTGGLLEQTMNTFAASHGGVAPVVVVVDPNGSDTANTMCMDSRIARADTYLAIDVPRWINSTLEVSADPRKWTVGGFSFGATCAVQMTTLHPEIYPSFIAFSGEREPSLGPDRRRTIQTAFGGDSAAFEALTPLTLMKQRSYDGHAGYFAVGAADHEFAGFANEMAAAARTSGFEIRHASVAGAGHSWAVAVQELPSAMEFLAPRWGLVQ
ncbi:alpha/beta hydrolase [Arthrobacter bambusae]|uniref:alpha/beta hydrolase n=1 Tax=Arthrobacter bambusae TaxID=1338426 RepID=UPI00278B4F7C|nr:alpha/beta hydrolase-fold protein [Arthrobacter bambusae]MDQ0031857.1 S-formylglutathione hydrolase FrmB [Arthrobacter bambusae]MDQ0099996.1 S-formylglutathione hydrolase FrmB [Arthrobacter bambusae]